MNKARELKKHITGLDANTFEVIKVWLKSEETDAYIGTLERVCCSFLEDYGDGGILEEPWYSVDDNRDLIYFIPEYTYIEIEATYIGERKVVKNRGVSL